MKSFMALVAFFCSALAIGQTCPVGYIWDDCNRPVVGPGGCVSQCVVDPNYNSADPVGPDNFCINDSCYSVVYQWVDRCVVASAKIGSLSYQVLGWAGPCLSNNNANCPDIKNQAHRDLYTNSLRITRSWRVGP